MKNSLYIFKNKTAWVGQKGAGGGFCSVVEAGSQKSCWLVVTRRKEPVMETGLPNAQVGRAVWLNNACQGFQGRSSVQTGVNKYIGF